VKNLMIRPFRASEADDVAGWTYEPPFDIYNGDPGHPEEYLAIDERGFGYYAIVSAPDDELVGFCCFGPEATVPGQGIEVGTVDLGCGLRPDVLSQGIATRVLPAIMDFAHEQFAPRKFRTAVASFNERATRLCLSAGFEVVRRFPGPGREFQELTRTAR
jgi:ribosomal-protein-alanine N-acetyltransferase